MVWAGLLAAPSEGAQRVDPAKVFFTPETATLARAVLAGDAGEVRQLAARSRLDAVGEQGITLLQWALLNKSLPGLKALLQAGADPRQPGTGGASVVHLAAMADDPAYLDALLAAGADANVQHAQSGATPLMSALTAQREAQFHRLLQARVDLDRTDRQGNTALHVAAKVNAADRVLELLRAGANPVLRNGQGATFMRYLAMTPAQVLSPQALSQRRAVEALLRERGIGQEP